MNIGFDAKRAYHNGTGLGHYSRTLVQLLSARFPEHACYLFNPKPSGRYTIQGANIHEILPSGFLNKTFSSAWRSSWVKKDLKRLKIGLFHGLSHEIPVGIQKTGIPSVVTIHDLIHERHPGQYNPVDVRIYRKKFRYACAHADRVIAISEQTRRDIIDIYGTPAEKISVCYQSCNPIFGEPVPEEKKKAIKTKYGLPDQFFLYVGSLIERKNLLGIAKAMFLLRNEINTPLVVIGDGGKYKRQVKDFIRQHGLEQRILFLSENETVRRDPDFISAAAFPAIYQQATAMIYPSFFEGFGIPVLEALWSRLPVITSGVSCLPEAGGPGSYYVDPSSAEEIAAGMKKILADKDFAKEMKNKGLAYARQFAPELYADNMMNIYKMVW